MKKFKSKSLSLLAASGWDCIISIIIINIYIYPPKKKKGKRIKNKEVVQIYSLTKISPKPIVLLLSTQESMPAPQGVRPSWSPRSGRWPARGGHWGSPCCCTWAGPAGCSRCGPRAGTAPRWASTGWWCAGWTCRRWGCGRCPSGTLQRNKGGWAGGQLKDLPCGLHQQQSSAPPAWRRWNPDWSPCSQPGPSWLPGELQHSKASARQEHWPLSIVSYPLSITESEWLRLKGPLQVLGPNPLLK